MMLENTVIFRVPEELKGQLESVAKKLGLSKSAIARNTLALAIIPPKRASKNRLSDYVSRHRKKMLKELMEPKKTGLSNR